MTIQATVRASERSARGSLANAILGKRPRLWIFVLLAALAVASRSNAQTDATQKIANVNPFGSGRHLAADSFDAAFPTPGKSSDSTQCQVRVVENKVIVSDKERHEVGHRAQPPGIIPNPNIWPYFAWADTPLGIVRSLDGSGYLFFGSDGGCHFDCFGASQRWGSVTVSKGTLDHPLGEPLGNPNPAVFEFTFPVTTNLPGDIDYAGGGPVYRVPQGEPGAGSLLLVYHIERSANPFFSWTGLAKSVDEGMSWQDLGLILSVPHPYNSRGASGVGENPLVPYFDPITQQKYFYIFFPHHCWIGNNQCADFTFISVARVGYEDLLTAAAAGNQVSGMFTKYYNGKWDQPGLGGWASETFPGVTGETDGDFQIVWSAYRQRFVAIVDNAQYIAYGESVDGLYWPPMQVLVGATNPNLVYGYANAVGLGEDPGVLGDTFYSYYHSAVGWQPATENRLTITTASSVSKLVPSSVAAGSSGFTLTVDGEAFVNGSKVLWNGSQRPTTFVHPGRVTAEISASDVASAEEAHVTVWSPAPCGGVSNVEDFVVTSAVAPNTR